MEESGCSEFQFSKVACEASVIAKESTWIAALRAIALIQPVRFSRYDEDASTTDETYQKLLPPPSDELIQGQVVKKQSEQAFAAIQKSDRSLSFR